MRITDMFGHDTRTYRGAAGHRWSDLYGIELELEGVQNMETLRLEGIPGWVVHRDESLRNGIELVTAQPVGGIPLQRAIVNYFSEEVQSESTERSSTHIHINMTDSDMDAVRSMITMMYVIEGPLFAVVGEARKWCGYAMPLSDMPTRRLSAIMTADALGQLASHVAPGRNQERYYGFNVASLRRHGTVEFRYFPGDPSREELESWLDLVTAVKVAAKSYTVTDINTRVNSSEDWAVFLRDVLPERWFVDLMRVSSPEEMFESYTAIASLVEAEVPIQPRREPLIFLTEPLVVYTSKLYGEKGGKYLKDKAAELSVIHSSEWRYHLDRAAMIDAGIGDESEDYDVHVGTPRYVIREDGRPDPIEAFRAALRPTPVYGGIDEQF